MTAPLVMRGAALVILLSTWCGAQQGSSASIVDICDLVQRPGDYVGKIVRVQGDVFSGWARHGHPINEFSIKQPFSSTRCVAQLKIIVPAEAKPGTGTELRRDDAFRRLDEALHASMTITGTFEGKFESSAKTTSTKVRQSALRLVLQQVADVDAHVVYNK